MSSAENNLIYLAASGDLRLSANRVCWAAQEAAEREVIAAVESFGLRVQRAHAYDPEAGHGFLDSQRRGLDVFATIPADAPVIVVEAVWQYSHHVLPGLYRHRGPILTVANWSGQWPGLVGLLNLNGSLTKAGVNYSTLWSEDFKDGYFLERLGHWLAGGQVRHDDGHVKPLGDFAVPAKAAEVGGAVAAELGRRPAILGVFDEGCMGMYNAIIPDELLHAGLCLSIRPMRKANRQQKKRKGRYTTGRYHGSRSARPTRLPQGLPRPRLLAPRAFMLGDVLKAGSRTSRYGRVDFQVATPSATTSFELSQCISGYFLRIMVDAR